MEVEKQFLPEIAAGIITQGALRDSSSQKLRQELSRAFERQFFVEIATGIITGNCERQFVAEIVEGSITQEALRDCVSKKLWQELSRSEH